MPCPRRLHLMVFFSLSFLSYFSSLCSLSLVVYFVYGAFRFQSIFLCLFIIKSEFSLVVRVIIGVLIRLLFQGCDAPVWDGPCFCIGQHKSLDISLSDIDV